MCRLTYRRLKSSLASYYRLLSSQNMFWSKAAEVDRSIDVAMKRENYDILKMKCTEWNENIGDMTWNNAAHDAAIFKNIVDYFDNLRDEYNSIVHLYELGEAEGELDILELCQRDLVNIEENVRQRNVARILSSEIDHSSCYAEIIAGVGGMDAYDWTRMLTSMYYHWATAVMGFRAQYVDEQVADQSSSSEVLYRRVTLRVDGHKAYGYFKAEAGVHRLVRRSPFDPTDKRHTSFAQVRVFPVSPDEDASTSPFSGFHMDLK